MFMKNVSPSPVHTCTPEGRTQGLPVENAGCGIGDWGLKKKKVQREEFRSGLGEEGGTGRYESGGGCKNST